MAEPSLTTDARRASTLPRGLDWLWILLACGAVFANALGNAFHLDDFYRVVDNPGIAHFWPPWRHFLDPRTMSTEPGIVQFRPLLPLSLSLQIAIHGESLVGFHLGNLLVHASASLLVYELGRELGAGRGVARFAALAFAVHPVSGILVNYICARDQILMLAFLALFLLLYARRQRLGDSVGRQAGCLLALALSLLSKTDALVAPLLVVLFEVTIAGQSGRRLATWWRAVPAAVVVAAFFAYTTLVLGFSDLAQVEAPTSRLAYAWTQARLHVFRYLAQLAWPFTMAVDPRVELAGLTDARAWLGAAVIGGSLCGAWLVRRRQPLLAFSALAYWTLLVPTSSFVPLHALAVDYRPYPASPFAFLAVGLLGRRFLPGKLRLPLAALAVAYLAVASFLLNRIWRTEETLWRHSVALGGSALAHHNLAMSLPGGDERRRHLEEALRLQPSYTLARINLGRLLVWQGNHATGLAEVERAARDHPSSARARFWLGLTYAELGRSEDARQAYLAAADLDPDNLEYQHEAARAEQGVGRFAESLRFLDRLQARQPTYARTQYLRGFALQKTGRGGEAIEAYRAFLRDQPDADVAGQAWFNLGVALEAAERWPEAVTAFEAALARRPDSADARQHLEACRARAR